METSTRREQGPRVDVIILNYNGKAVLADCLRSVLASDYPNLQVMVVDNNSKDGSVDDLETRFPAVMLVRSPTNLGTAGGNNLGMRRALQEGADYILLLNNDTVVDAQCISNLVRAAEGDASGGALHPKAYYADPPDRLWYAGGSFSLWKGISQHRGRKEVDAGQYDTQQEVTHVSGCALLLPVPVLREVGLLDGRLFMYAEDTDLSIRIRRAGYRLLYVPQARLWHKEGYASRGHLGQAFRYHLYVRNSLLVLTRYARPIQLPVAYGYFLVDAVLRLTVLALLHGDWPAAMAPLRGVLDFVKMTAAGQSRPASQTPATEA